LELEQEYRTSNEYQIINSMIDLAHCLIQLKKFSECLKLLQEGMKLYKKIETEEEERRQEKIKGFLTILMVSCYNGLDQDEMALKLINGFLYSVDVMQFPDNDQEEEIQAAYAEAFSNYCKNNWAKALQYSKKTLALIGMAKHTKQMIAAVLHSLILNELGRLTEAGKAVKNAIDAEKNEEDPENAIYDYIYAVLILVGRVDDEIVKIRILQHQKVLVSQVVTSELVTSVLDNVQANPGSKSTSEAMRQLARFARSGHEHNPLMYLTKAFDLLSEKDDFEARAVIFANRASFFRCNYDMSMEMFDESENWLGNDFEKLDHVQDEHKAAYVIRGLCYQDSSFIQTGEKQIEEVVEWTLDQHREGGDNDFLDSIKGICKFLSCKGDEKRFLSIADDVIDECDVQKLTRQDKKKFQSYFNTRMIDLKDVDMWMFGIF
jgi:hypothetical protein